MMTFFKNVEIICWKNSAIFVCLKLSFIKLLINSLYSYYLKKLSEWYCTFNFSFLYAFLISRFLGVFLVWIFSNCLCDFLHYITSLEIFCQFTVFVSLAARGMSVSVAMQAGLERFYWVPQFMYSIKYRWTPKPL